MVAAIGAVAAVGGAAISSSASRSAANQQADSAEAATAAQERAAAQMREDLSPWTNQGRSANNALGYYLGLNTTGAGGGASSSSSAPPHTYESLREQLRGQYTRNVRGGGAPPSEPGGNPMGQFYNSVEPSYQQNFNAQGDYLGLQPRTWEESQIDEAGLDAAIRARLAEQDAATAAAQTAAQTAAEKDPKYGSLLQAYRNGEEFDAGPAFSFTGQDLASEPGYQFGLNQGEQGISRGQASRGNYLSGAAMKEINRFNQDYAGTKFNDAFNRASSTYGTNLTARQNEWNTNLNAYNGNRDRIYNFLTGVSTLGQNSAAQVGANNQQAATQAGNNMMAAGNAQAAGTVAAGNALQSGINGAANAFNSNNNLNSAGGWNNLLAQQGGGYSGYTGYTGTNDSIANLNASRGWTG